MCRRRRQIDPVCRLAMTQCDDLEPVAGLGAATAEGGSVKSWRLGQICVGANSAPLADSESEISGSFNSKSRV